MSVTVTALTGEEWRAANLRYLSAETERLRLLLRRRILWLRQHWRRDSPPARLVWAISDQEAETLLFAEDPSQEFAFYESDAGAREIAAALEQSRSQIAALRQELEESGTPAPIDILSARFALTAFEREVLLLCLAPEFDPSFERIYAYVQDDATRRWVTPHLVLTLLSNGVEFAAQHRGALLPGGTLRRWHLVVADHEKSGSTQSASALHMDERTLDYLLGFTRLDGRCQRLVRSAPSVPVASCQRELASQLGRWLQTGENRFTLLNLMGRPDSGRMAIARAACDEAGLNLLVLDSCALYSAGPERAELIALLEREASLLGLVFYFDHDGLKREDSHALLMDLERCAAPLVLASRERLTCEREMLAVRVSRPDASSQSAFWKQALGASANSLGGEIDSIVEQFDLGPMGIARTVARAESQATLFADRAKAPSIEDLWQACRHQASGHLEELAERIEPCYDWDDIVVPSRVLRQLREITSQVAHRHLVYQGWGFGKKLSRGRGISALFSGASGVGKTMAAEVMARHLNLDLYRIDLAGVVSKYIGETEKNLRRVFDAAERSGAILFFDEADALFGKRSEVKDSHDRYANIEVNYLLQRMEDYRGLAILATNMKSALDSAFMRRLRFIVDFPFPDAAQRKTIWQKVFPSAAALDGLDFGVLSRLEIPGGNIRNIAVNAAFLAAGEGCSISMPHVMRAAHREYTKVDRLIMDAEFGPYATLGASS